MSSLYANIWNITMFYDKVNRLGKRLTLEAYLLVHTGYSS